MDVCMEAGKICQCTKNSRICGTYMFAILRDNPLRLGLITNLKVLFSAMSIVSRYLGYIKLWNYRDKGLTVEFGWNCMWRAWTINEFKRITSCVWTKKLKQCWWVELSSMSYLISSAKPGLMRALGERKLYDRDLLYHQFLGREMFFTISSCNLENARNVCLNILTSQSFAQKNTKESFNWKILVN